MDDFVEASPNWQGPYNPYAQYAPAPRKSWRKWLLLGGVAAAITLVLGLGVFLGTQIATSNAAAGNTNNSQVSNNPGTGFAPGGFNGSQAFAATPGAHGQGQCENYTVSSVSGNTITAKSANGSTVTIHTTSSTKYTKSGQAASASAVTADSHISVMGTHNSDGSITASSIDVR